MLSTVFQILMLGTFIGLLALLWHASKRPRWQGRAIVYGWAAIVVWALIWTWLVPTWTKGIMDAQTRVATFLPGETAMLFLVFGWGLPLIMVAIVRSKERNKKK